MEEYVDVLDSSGNLTGENKLKSEVHRDGDWHKAVHVWIINPKGELLIQKRSAIKDNLPNMWDIPSAGHLSAGEDSITSAIRETEEELGLKLLSENFEYLFSITQQSIREDGSYINNEFNDIYLVRLDLNLAGFKLQEDEVAEIKFIPYKELEKIINRGDEEFISHPKEYEKLFEELHKRY